MEELEIRASRRVGQDRHIDPVAPAVRGAQVSLAGLPSEFSSLLITPQYQTERCCGSASTRSAAGRPGST